MGRYSKHKEDLGIALTKLKELEQANVSNEIKKEAFDRWNRQAQTAAAKIKEYGIGKVFRFQAPQGAFYLVDIDPTDIPELMKDMGVESYLYTEIETGKLLKL